MKNIYFIVLSILIIFYMIFSIRKNKLGISNSFVWIVFCIILLILSIFPKSIDFVADFIGIEYPPALFLTICVVVLAIRDFNYSKELEDQKKKIIELEQHIAIMESEKNESK